MVIYKQFTTFSWMPRYDCIRISFKDAGKCVSGDKPEAYLEPS